MIENIRRVLADWNPNDYTLTQDGDVVRAGIGLDLIGTSPGNGGNAAGNLINTLHSAGYDLDPDDWQTLLAGATAVVTRQRMLTTKQVATCLYGPGPSGSRLTAAAEWCRRRSIEPTNPGFSPRLWPASEVDAALAERAAQVAAGSRPGGNRVSGEAKAEAATRGWVTRRRKVVEEKQPRKCINCGAPSPAEDLCDKCSANVELAPPEE